MAYDTFRDTALARALTDLMGDLSDLVRKELRLARAEMTQKLTNRLHAVVWLSAAGVAGLMALFLIVEGLVFALASTGLALYWACFLLAGVLAAIALLAFYYGWAGEARDFTPTRSVRQFNQALRTAKEQLK